MPKKSEGLEAWKKRRRDFQESGLNRREYCKKAGIKESTLDYWFSKIRKIEQNNGFVEVHPAPKQLPQAGLVVTVGKFRVEINGAEGVVLLCDTLKALDSMT
jgi:hypothetical protein